MKIIDIKKLGRSFRVAFSGLGYATLHENTFKIGVFIAAVVIFFTFYFPLSRAERAVIFLTILSVLGMELLNMQIEKATDLIDSNHNREIRIIKDLAAGAVLLLLLGALIVAILIFLPYIINN